jgi:hypothetical protein
MTIPVSRVLVVYFIETHIYILRKKVLAIRIFTIVYDIKHCIFVYRNETGYG